MPSIWTLMKLRRWSGGHADPREIRIIAPK